MKPAFSAISTNPGLGTYGDCARACVASIFELPIEWVPHFCERGEEPPIDGQAPWVGRLRAWALEKGFQPVFVTIEGPDRHWPASAMQFHHMRWGLSHGGAAHWVVYFGDDLAHDPAIDRRPETPPGLQEAYPQMYLFFVKS